ncbi:hypothetical protein RFI_38164 [Reticulomyxa filosa]|uniref:Uncharacterized protein n=1 Tax=Reticulomyxa filosa TaxID=46433 RepID=X6LBC5_RETFI|nr:hypothetical protein RFI_38164 [Reticulomyxa filosa]|eukprot:ETN99317.1 hypothetical protein RFI_38164 [Reticulomyxa filosa]
MPYVSQNSLQGKKMYKKKTKVVFLANHCGPKQNKQDIIWNSIYNVVNVLLNILGFTINLYMLTDYYDKGKFIFYYLSLSIFLFTQVAYCVSCTKKYSRSYQAVWCIKILPFSLIIPYFYYLQIWMKKKDEIKCQFHIILIQLLAVIGVFGVTFVFGPIYLLSHFLIIFFSAIFVIYIYYFNLWSHIGTLQIIMTCAYTCLLCLCFLFLILVIRINYLLWHINHGMYASFGLISLSNIKKRYNLINNLLIQDKLLMELFGKDLGSIINIYLPKIKDLKTGRENIHVY